MDSAIYGWNPEARNTLSLLQDGLAQYLGHGMQKVTETEISDKTVGLFLWLSWPGVSEACGNGLQEQFWKGYRRKLEKLQNTVIIA